MGVDAINLYGSSSQTMDAGSWGEADTDTTRHEDTAGWTADTTNHDVTQDSAGTVIILASAAAYNGSKNNIDSGNLRLEVDTGSGFGAISGTETRVQYDDDPESGGALLFAAVSGSATDAYRLGIREDHGGSSTLLAGANLCGFYAPGSVCYVVGSTDVEGSTSYTDITLTSTGGLVESGFSLASNEVTVSDAGDYLIFYRVRVEPDSDGADAFYAQLTVDTGGGHSAIAGTEVPGYSYTTQGGNVSGCLIYTTTGANHKIKLQFKNQARGTALDALAAGSALLICKLPSGAEGFSGYESSAAAPSTAYAAVDMDAEWFKNGFTHSTSTNPERVTLPAAAATLLVVGHVVHDSILGAHQDLGAKLYTDLGGTPTAVAGCEGRHYIYGSNADGGTAAFCMIDGFSSSDIIGLYGYVDASPSAKANSQLTILRLDNLGDSGGAITATVAGSGSVTAAATGTGKLAATVAGAGSVVADLGTPASPVTATVAGAGSVAAQLSGLAPIAATVAGSGSVTAGLRGIGNAVATVAGSGSAVADLKGTGSAVGVVAGAGSVVADLKGAGAAAATVAGAGSITADLAGLGAGSSATLAGSGSVVADLTGTGAAVAAVAGAGSVSANLNGFAPAAATTAGAGSVVADLKGTGAGVATLAGAGSVVADLKGQGALASAVAGAGSVVANLIGLAPISAAVSGAGSVVAALAGNGLIAAVLSGTSSLAGSIAAAIYGTVSGTGSVVANLTGIGSVLSAVAGAGSIAADLTLDQNVSVTLAGAGSYGGAVLIGYAPISCTLSGSCTFTPSLEQPPSEFNTEGFLSQREIENRTRFGWLFFNDRKF